MSKGRRIALIIFGALVVSIALGVFLESSDYILSGKTVNLNEVLENGGEMPKGEYVTFICEVPLGSYAYTQQYLNGFIPLPFKTHQYAMLSSTGMILSAEISSKSLMEQMDESLDAFFVQDKAMPVALVGRLGTNNSEMRSFLSDYIRDILGSSFQQLGIEESTHLIDTTQTRLWQAALCIFLFALGAFLIACGVRPKQNTPA